MSRPGGCGARKLWESVLETLVSVSLALVWESAWTRVSLQAPLGPNWLLRRTTAAPGRKCATVVLVIIR